MDESEAQLVAAARMGDQESYGALVHRHLARIFAICLSLTGNTHDAEDVTQEVFLVAHRKLPELRDDERFAGWTARIAHNRALDHMRSQQRRREFQLEEDLESPHIPGDHSELRRALQRLSEEHRTPLLLYYYDGKSVQALADELGLSEGGACARLYRARRRLRTILEEEEVTNRG